MTIKEVWDGLPALSKSEIMLSLQKKGASYSAAWCWCNGTRTPRKFFRPQIVAVINTVTKSKYTEADLWPECES